MRITACWITKDEEKTLARSVQSLKDAADELLVLDTGSADGTRALAARLGARVEEFAWVGDFAAARNRALELATGEIVIFLDADEWFVPALTPQDKQEMVGAFAADSSLEVLQLNLFNVDPYGAVQSSLLVDRVLRNSPQLRYHGAIHERLLHKNGKAPGKLAFPRRWNLHHSGYQPALMPQKMRRNIQLLERALETTPPGSKARMMHHAYLMREYKTIGETPKALPHLEYMLRNPGGLAAVCREYRENFIGLLYAALECALFLRGSVSRREVRRLVGAMETHYPRFAGSATVGLLYQVWFDLKEDALLEQLPGALALARQRGESSPGKAKDSELILLSYAARAQWLRRNKLEAMELAVQAAGGNQAETLQILLGCVRGQPVGEVAALLGSICDLQNPETLAFLVNNTRLEGYRDLYIYFVKKQIDAGAATKGTFLYLQLLLGKLEESIAFALSLGEENAQVVAEHLSLCILSTGREDLLAAHRDRLGRYTRVLEAYFAGAPLAEITSADAAALLNLYQPLAFAAGLDAAEKLRALYLDGAPVAAYTTLARCCLANEQYEYLLEQDTARLPFDDVSARSLGIQAMLLTGSYDRALAEVETMLTLDVVAPPLLRWLLVVAQCAGGSVGIQARELYDRYLPVSDALIDLSDLLRTGATEEPSPRALAALKRQTLGELERLVAEDAAQPAPTRLQQLYTQAAALYESKKMPGDAYRCYRWLLAHNCDRPGAAQGLARALLALGNKTLAQEAGKLS